MSVLEANVLKTGKGGQPVTGVVLIKNYSIQLTKNGKEYVSGTLQSGIEMPFKAWGNSTAFSKLKNEDYALMTTNIVGSFDEYQGSISIIVNDVQAVEGYTTDQFLPVKYNADAYYDSLVNEVKAGVSDKAFQLAKIILFDNAELVNRFKIEFAAEHMHDNCKSGLLAHTYKVVCITKYILGMYSGLSNNADGTQNPDFKDLCILGALLHDIGKVDEMQLGVYQSCSSVTHRFLGIEHIEPYKDIIVSEYSLEWYYQLVSVLLQHHDEFDDKARTTAAFIVFKADYLDAQMTMIQQAMEKPVDTGTVQRIKFDGRWLQLL